MGESVTHLQLVRAILSWTATRTELCQQSALLFSVSESTRQDMPPNIGGVVPDVYLKDESSGTVLIGEAKTSWDVETKKTRAQLVAYLSYLREFRDPILVLAVPWHCVNQMRSLVRLLQQRTGASSVNIYVLEKLPG